MRILITSGHMKNVGFHTVAHKQLVHDRARYRGSYFWLSGVLLKVTALGESLETDYSWFIFKRSSISPITTLGHVNKPAKHIPPFIATPRGPGFVTHASLNCER